MQSILQDFNGKIKSVFSSLVADQRIFMAILLVIVALSSFGLGRQSIKEPAAPVTLQASETDRHTEIPSATKLAATSSQRYVASKNGTAYHLLICPGAKQISEKNKIYFNTKEEAEAAGYRPAANCKGI